MLFFKNTASQISIFSLRAVSWRLNFEKIMYYLFTFSSSLSLLPTSVATAQLAKFARRHHSIDFELYLAKRSCNSSSNIGGASWPVAYAHRRMAKNANFHGTDFSILLCKSQISIRDNINYVEPFVSWFSFNFIQKHSMLQIMW